MAEYIIDGTSSNPSIKEMKQPKHYITMTSTSSSFNINSSNDGNKIYIPHRPIWLKIPIQCHNMIDIHLIVANTLKSSGPKT